MTHETNWQRAEEGLKLCALMQKTTGVSTLKEQISDAICHLMHTARLVRDEDGDMIDFASILANAETNFDAEVENCHD